MAEREDRKGNGEHAAGQDQANVGRRERPTLGRSERRVDAASRPSVEMEHEVRQRASAPVDAHAPTDPASSHNPADDVPPGPQTSGYGQREDRENPAAGLGATQTGERQSQELPSTGFRAPRASSQNAGRLADFEHAPSRPSREPDRVSRPSQ